MIGNHWRAFSYETKAALALVAGVLVVLAGFFTATGVSGLASPTGTQGTAGEKVTINSVVTLTRSGERTVVRTVRVVTRVTGPAVLGTAVELRTVTTPGARDLVTVAGRARTIVETRPAKTRTRVVTNERVVTNRRVVTNERVVTNNRTVTSVRTQEVTVPVTTVRTVTESVAVTVVTTQVRTETVVPPTATVTVTCPPKGCG